jgi:hypothetical protein
MVWMTSSASDGTRRCGLTPSDWVAAVEEAVLSSTRAQQLPARLEDEAVLATVAAIFGKPLSGDQSAA